MVASDVAADEAVETDGHEAERPERDTTLNIHQRIHAVRCAVAGYIDKDKTQEIRKDGRKVGQFDYITHDNVTNHIRNAVNEYGIDIVPDLVSSVQNGNRCEITVRVDFINIDEPKDVSSMTVLSHGVDGQDKGPGKALSYAVKMAELKRFMLNSADDIEADNQEHIKEATQQDVERAEGKANRADADAIEALRMALQVIEKSGTLEDLDNLMEDPRNESLLARMPKRTREWFTNHADRIAELKKEQAQ